LEYHLFETSVTKACEGNWKAYKNECNFFVQAVASDLGILIPGGGGSADQMTWWISRWLEFSGQFLTIPPMSNAAYHAALFAREGKFVLAGMTAAELDRAHDLDWHPPLMIPPRQKHGHVAVVTPGFGENGWPRGYWGSHGSEGKKNASLSRAFPWRHPNLCHYFVSIKV